MPKAKSKIKLSLQEERKIREKILKHVTELLRNPFGSSYSTLGSYSSLLPSRYSITTTAKTPPKPQPPPPPPFKPDQSVLLIGEGSY